MSKSSRVIVLTLSLSALALVTDYSGRATAATSDKTKPARGKAAMTNGITPANVLITGKACDHKLTPRSATLHTMKDSLRWHIENSCTANQDVLLCVYEKATGRLKNPFLPCQPHPDSYDIGRVFNVAQHGNAEFDCTARDLGKYKKQVLVGSEVPVGGCPPKIGVVQIKMHILDTDIVP